MRFVILSFAVLGFAFYDLSGGADFEPRGVRPPKPERITQKQPAQPNTTPASVATLIPVEKAKLSRRKQAALRALEARAQPETQQAPVDLPRPNTAPATTSPPYTPV